MSDSFDPTIIDLAGGTVKTIQTSRTNPRVVLDSAGLRAFNAAGTQLFNLDASTGSLTTTAVIIAGPGSVIPAGFITGTIPAVQIGGGLTAAQIASVNASALAGQVTAAQIVSLAASQVTGQLTSAQIASVAASAITGQLVTTQIGNNSVTSAQIAANTIVAGNIAAGAITGTQIAANTITAGNINVTALSAISANLGTVTAGTITGVVLQTSAVDPRVAFDNTGFYITSATPVKVVSLDYTNGLSLAGGSSGVSTVTWHNGTIAGTVIGQIWSNRIIGTGTPSQIMIQALSTINSNMNATLVITANSSTDTGNSVGATAISQAGVNSGVSIIRGDGSSSFLQKANNLSEIASQATALANLGIGRGTGNLVFSASTSATATITHGLPFTPSAVVCTAKGALSYVVVEADTFTSTTFRVIGFVPGSISATLPFTWIAIQ